MRILLLLLALPMHLLAQNTAFRAFKDYPFPNELTTAATGARVAWALDEQGRRNIYVAEGPDFTPRKLTDYSRDDGQDLTSVSVSADGQWVIFVRGGDHGANWEGERPINSTSDLQPFKIQIASVRFGGGTVKFLSEGDDPVISPDSKEVAFIKENQAWLVPMDGSSPAKNLFTTRGKVSSLQWSPDGKRLLFVTDRTDHTVIGIYTKGSTELNWVAPSFYRDETPQWTLDGSRVIFIRRPGAGGAPDSMLSVRRLPWSIYSADTTGSPATLIWKSPHLHGDHFRVRKGRQIFIAQPETGLFSFPTRMGGRIYIQWMRREERPYC